MLEKGAVELRKKRRLKKRGGALDEDEAAKELADEEIDAVINDG